MYTDFNNIGHKMRDCINGFDDNSFCYKRYEILTDGKQFQIFEAKQNKTIPNCTFQHPLCKIYNAKLNANKAGLITFSFIVDYDCIRVYLLFSDGIKLYGTRIFKDDLINLVPKLFENSQLSPATQSQLDSLQFIVDHVYNEYDKRLRIDKPSRDDVIDKDEQKAFEQNSGGSSLVDRYPLVGRNWNIHHLIDEQVLNSQEIENFLNDNNIDSVYIKNHKRKQFAQLLKARLGIKAGVATQLWGCLGGFDADYDHDIIHYDQNEEKKNMDINEDTSDDLNCLKHY